MSLPGFRPTCNAPRATARENLLLMPCILLSETVLTSAIADTVTAWRTSRIGTSRATSQHSLTTQYPQIGGNRLRVSSQAGKLSERHVREAFQLSDLALEINPPSTCAVTYDGQDRQISIAGSVRITGRATWRDDEGQEKSVKTHDRFIGKAFFQHEAR